MNIESKKDAIDYVIDNYYYDLKSVIEKGVPLHIDQDLSVYINKYCEDDFTDGNGIKFFYIDNKSFSDRLLNRYYHKGNCECGKNNGCDMCGGFDDY